MVFKLKHCPMVADLMDQLWWGWERLMLLSREKLDNAMLKMTRYAAVALLAWTLSSTTFYCIWTSRVSYPTEAARR